LLEWYLVQLNQYLLSQEKSKSAKAFAFAYEALFILLA